MELRLALILALTGALVVSAAVPQHRRHQNNNQQNDISSQIQGERTEESETQIENILKDLCPRVKDEVTADVPAKFTQLVHLLSKCSHASAARLDKRVRANEFCDSAKLQDIWSDALIMDASEGSLRLIVDQIANGEVTPSRANYLYTMMSFAKNPTPGAVRAVLPILEQDKIQRQALLGISSLIRNSLAENGYRPRQETRDAVKAIAKYLKKNEKKPEKAVAALKALQNIQAIDDAKEQVLSVAEDKSQKTAVRVAALEALRGICSSQSVRSKALDIFRDASETAEIRIAAYKCAIEGADKETVQKIISVIKKEDNKQVGSFATSHLKNIQDSSSPRQQQVRDHLEDESIPTNRFPQDLRKYSRNIELSQYTERFGVGGVFEADIVYDRSVAPRSIKVNMTVPFNGEELNLFEIGVRQVGLENQAKKLLGPNGQLNGKNLPDLVSEIVDFFNEDEDNNEVRQGNRYSRAAAQRQQEQMQSLRQRLANADKDLEGSVEIRVDGKTIAYFDVNDLTHSDNDMSLVIKNLKEKIQRANLKTDRAFSVLFLNKEANKGNMGINGTIVAGIKADKNGIWPSVALEVSTRTGDKKNVQKISCAPALRFDVQHKKITFSLPKERMNLFSISTESFNVDQQGNERPTAAYNKKIEKCSSLFAQPLGVEFCSKAATPRKTGNSGLLDGLWGLEIEVVKTDRKMTGWEFTLELPNNSQSKIRAGFNTPGSEINRRIALELETFERMNGFRAQIETPHKTAELSTSYEYNRKEVNYKAEAIVADPRSQRPHRYAFEAGVKKNQSGKKTEWTPVLRIVSPYTQPLALGGNIAIDQGKKSQLSFDIHSETSDRKFLKGSFIKEGTLSTNKDFRLSSDFSADCEIFNFRIFGMSEKQQSSFSTDLKCDYQVQNGRKQSAKIVGKLQNLSAQGFAKLNSFVEVQMTQFPENNFHLSWNYLNRPMEHIENEITLMWAHQMRNQDKKIHILQVTKLAGIKSSGQTAAIDNTISVEVAPLKLKYEIKANGHAERQSANSKKYRVNVEVNNKNEKNRDLQASLEYQRQSQSPLKMSIDASLNIPNGGNNRREIKYSDKIEETSPRTYKGKTHFQWAQDKKFNLDYTLKDRSDNRKTDLELDSELKTPNMKFGLSHQGALRVTRDNMEVQSKMNYERKNLWELQTNLNKHDKSQVQLVTKGFTGKIEAVPTGSQKSALVEMNGEDWSHYTNLASNPDSTTLSSKTLSNNKPVVVINARKNKKDSTRVNIESSLFDARAEVNAQSAAKSASFDYKGKTGDRVTLKGKTIFTSPFDAEAQFEGKSDSRPLRSVNLRVKADKKEGVAEVLSKENGQEWVNSRASYSLGQTIDYNFRVTRRGEEYCRLDTRFSRDAIRGPHDIEVSYPRKGSQENIKVRHEIVNGQLKVTASHKKDGNEKASAELNCQAKELNRENVDFDASVSLKCDKKFKGVNAFKAAASHRHQNRRDSFEFSSQIQASLNENKAYQAKVDCQVDKKKNGKASLNIDVQTPKRGYESQTGRIDASWEANKQAKISIKGTNAQQKSVEMMATATKDKQTQRYTLDGNLRSDFRQIPSARVEATAQNSDNQKSASLSARVNDQQVININGQADVKDAYNFKGQVEGKYKDSAKYSAFLESNKAGKKIQYTAQANRDGQRLLDAQASHEKQERGNYRHTLRVNCQPKKIQANWDSTVNCEDPLSGPHDVEVTVNQRSLRAHHEVKDGNIKESAKYTENGNEKASFNSNGQYRKERNNFELDLNTQIKTLCRKNIEHQGHLKVTRDEAEHKCRLSVNQKNYYDAKALLSKKNPSYIQMTSEVYPAQGKIEIMPFGKDKQVDIDFNGQKISHKTQARFNPRQISLDTKTTKDGKTLFAVDARSDRENNHQARFECPALEASAQANLPTSGSFDIKEKMGQENQVKGKITINNDQEAEVHIEGKNNDTPLRVMNIRVRRESDNKGKIEIRSQENNQEWVICNAEGSVDRQWIKGKFYLSKRGEEVAQFDANINRKALLSGPHSCEASYRGTPGLPGRNGEKNTLKLTHHINEEGLRTQLTHSRNGQQKAHAQVSGNGKLSKRGIDFSAGVKLQGEKRIQGIEGLDLTISHRHNCQRGSFESNSAFKAVLNGYTACQVKVASQADLKREGKAALLVDVQTPVEGYESQTGKIDASWDDDKAKVTLKASNAQQKSLTVEGKIQKDDERIQCEGNVKSDYKQIPSARLDAQADWKSVSVSARVEDNEVLNIKGHADVKSAANFKAQLEGKVADYPKYAASVESRKTGRKITCTAQATRDGKQLFDAEAYHEEQRDKYRHTLRFNCQAKEIQAQWESNINKNIFRGPHDIEGKYNRHAIQAHHEIRDGNIQENVKYSKDGEEKSSASVEGKYKEERSHFELQLRSQVKPSPKKSYEHEAQVRLTRDEAEYNCRLSSNQKNYWNMKARLSRKNPSHLEIESEPMNIQGKVEVMPFGKDKAFDVDIVCKKFNHKTQGRWNPRQISFDSKTADKQAQNVLSLKANSDRKGAHQVQVECPAFEVKGETNLPKAASFEIKEKKGEQQQVKGKLNLISENDAEIYLEGKTSKNSPLRTFDVKVKRSDNQANFEIRSQEDNKEWFTSHAEYTTNRRNTQGKFYIVQDGKQIGQVSATLSPDYLAGPHDVEITFNRRGQKEAIKFNHEIRQGLRTTLSHSKNGQQKAFADLTADGKITRQGIEANAAFKAHCDKKIRGVNNVEATFSHRHGLRRDGLESNSVFKATVNGNEVCHVKVDSDAEFRRHGKATLNIYVQTPIKNYETQKGQLQATWGDNRVKVSAKGINAQNKAIEVSGEAAATERRYSVEGNLQSDFDEIPNSRIIAALEDKKNLSLNAQVRDEEVLNFNGLADGQKGRRAYAISYAAKGIQPGNYRVYESEVAPITKYFSKGQSRGF